MSLRSGCITIAPNGPYRVTGGIPLIQRYPAESRYGEPLAWDPVGAPEPERPVELDYWLCRCGHSSDKPYCDGTHKKIQWDGALTAPREPSAARRVTLEGDGVVMTDEPRICAGTGFCGTRFTNVWEMIERTADPEVRARLVEMVKNCPSGRLEVTLAGEEAPEEPEFAPSIAVVPDGPLWVRGGIEIQAPDGFTYEVRNRVTLCRCGESHNKPFCDGAHEKIGFKASLKE